MELQDKLDGCVGWSKQSGACEAQGLGRPGLRAIVRDASRRPRLRSWFKEYDLNDNGELDRAELTQLLLFLHPEHPPDDALLDMLIERATAVESYSLQLRGSKDGVVSRMAAEKTIQRHDAYIRQKETLDGIFTKHDKDFVRLALPSPALPPPLPAPAASAAAAAPAAFCLFRRAAQAAHAAHAAHVAHAAHATHAPPPPPHHAPSRPLCHSRATSTARKCSP